MSRQGTKTGGLFSSFGIWKFIFGTSDNRARVREYYKGVFWWENREKAWIAMDFQDAKEEQKIRKRERSGDEGGFSNVSVLHFLCAYTHTPHQIASQ